VTTLPSPRHRSRPAARSRSAADRLDGVNGPRLPPSLLVSERPSHLAPRRSWGLRALPPVAMGLGRLGARRGEPSAVGIGSSAAAIFRLDGLGARLRGLGLALVGAGLGSFGALKKKCS
jgi:hypothetical protein